MSILAYNITNPALYIAGLLTTQEQTFVTNLVGLSYSEGDILYYDGSSLTNLGIGTNGYVLKSDGSVPYWGTGGGGSSVITDLTATAWRVFYSDSSGNLTELALGTSGTYLKSNGASSAPSWGTPGGSGDVVGPASATDLGIARFDGTTGKLIKNSVVTIDVNGAITVAGNYTLPYTDGTTGQTLQTDGAGTVTWSSAGSGDVSGPASSTDNAITRFDSTTGKVIQNSGATLDDTGKISAASLNLSGLTASQIIATDGSKNLQTLTTATYPSLTELSYVKGVTSAIQTQIDAKGTGTIGGSTGATDNALIRANGTGGSTVQSSGVTLGDSNNMNITVADTTNVVGLTIVQNDATNDPLALEVNGKHAGGVAKVTPYTLVQYNDTDGNNSDWSFNVAGNGGISLNLQTTGGTLDAPTATTNGTGIASINWYAYNSSNVQKQISYIDSIINDNTAGAEYGYIGLDVIQNGSLINQLGIGYQPSNGFTINGISVGDGASAGEVTSNGNQDLILQTGNATTGNITITDGANGNITLSPNGTGKSAFLTSLIPTANDGAALGISGTAFSDLFLASGGVIDWAAGDISFVHSSGQISLMDTASGATGPIFEIYQDSASPASSDIVSTINFYGRDSAANKQKYGYIQSVIGSPTSTTEQSLMYFGTILSGSFNEMHLSGSALYPGTSDTMTLGTISLMWSDLFLASGGVINWNNGNATLTHSAGLLTSNVPLSLGTSNAITVGSIELGAASDTTISRVSAGKIAVEGVNVVTTSSTDTLTNKTLTTPTIQQVNSTTNNPIKLNAGSYTPTQSYSPTGGGTATLDLSLGNIHFITMPAGNITIALSNATVGQVFMVRILQDATGSRTVTWFTTIKWAGGSAPTLTTTASKADTLGFVCTGSGTFDGFVIGQNI